MLKPRLRQIRPRSRRIHQKWCLCPMQKCRSPPESGNIYTAWQKIARAKIRSVPDAVNVPDTVADIVVTLEAPVIAPALNATPEIVLVPLRFAPEPTSEEKPEKPVTLLNGDTIETYRPRRRSMPQRPRWLKTQRQKSCWCQRETLLILTMK